MSRGSDVFVTGGTGYIGRPLVLELLVRAVENPPRGVRILEVLAIRGQASAGRDDLPE
jgi:nucleoside-diphosphate-sugar epimerase